MSDFIRFFCICISVLNVLSASVNSSNTNFASLPVELQASCLQDTSVADKMDLLKSAYRSLLLHCIEIRKQASLFPEDLKSISEIPPLAATSEFQTCSQYTPSRTLNIPAREISANVEIIASHASAGAWNANTVCGQDIWELERLKSVILRALEELDVTLDKVRELLVKCGNMSIELRSNVYVWDLGYLKSTIRSLKSFNVLLAYSKVDLHLIKLSNPADWVPVMQFLPATVKKLDLGEVNIDASGLRELSRLTNLEEIDLRSVKLSNPANWASVMQSLPVTVRKINLEWANIDASGLCELSRLDRLEEINLRMARLTNRDNWGSVIQSLPATLKKICLLGSDIDVSGLRELSALTSLEELDLVHVKLTNRDNWGLVIKSIPVTVKKLDLSWSNIDASGLCELSRLACLEELDLRNVRLINPADWVQVIQSLPVTLRKIDIHCPYIDASGLCELSCLTSLEELGLCEVELTNPADWVQVIQSLPVTLRTVYLDSTNIDVSDFQELSRLTGVEFISLSRVELMNPANWITVIQSLPVTVRQIDFSMTDIKASGLCALSCLARLEDINLYYVKLTNQDGWVKVIESLPATVRKMNLNETDIKASGLCALSCLARLEDINLYNVKLTNRDGWVTVIKSLPATVRKLDLSWTNIDASGLRELSRLTSLKEIGLCKVELNNPADWVLAIESLPATVSKIHLGFSNCPDDLKQKLRSRIIVIKNYCFESYYRKRSIIS